MNLIIIAVNILAAIIQFAVNSDSQFSMFLAGINIGVAIIFTASLLANNTSKERSK